MHKRKFSNMNIKRYSELVRSAVLLGVNYDDIIAETRRYHGNEFGNKVEDAVRPMLRR
jgi:hypothetical protein